MNLAELDTRIVIEQEVRTMDVQGGATVEWTTHAARWAKMEAVSGAARFFASQDMSEASQKFTIRRTSGVTTKMRVRVEKDGQVFYIKDIRPEGPGSQYDVIFAGNRQAEAST